MTTNLETISKQVSLLNRLLQLLRMPDKVVYSHKSTEFCKPAGGDYYIFDKKAWSDELVRVARELIPGIIINKADKSSVELLAELKDKDIELHVQRLLQAFFAIPSTDRQCVQYTFSLEAILNKYNRSLNE